MSKSVQKNISGLIKLLCMIGKVHKNCMRNDSNIKAPVLQLLGTKSTQIGERMCKAFSKGFSSVHQAFI